MAHMLKVLTKLHVPYASVSVGIFFNFDVICIESVCSFPFVFFNLTFLFVL